MMHAQPNPTGGETEPSAPGIEERSFDDPLLDCLVLLRQQALLKLAEDNLAAHERIHDQIRLRSESGVGRTADLDQVEGRLARAEANLVAARNNVKEAEAAYIRVVGVPPETVERPAGAEAALPSTVEQAISSGLNNHPTLKSSLADVDAALAQHEASKHAFYPRFDIEVGRTWNEDWDGREGEDEDLTAMLRMRWNLFNGGADTARKQQTAHLINEAKEISNNTQRQVEESLRLSWTAYQSTKDQRDYLQKHVEATKRTREAYTKQFNIGQRTLLDVLDTENEVFEASRAFVTADYTNLFAQYRLLVGMGTFFETLGMELPAEATPLAANTSAE
jgi:adhesin transport system outer membrane protein